MPFSLNTEPRVVPLRADDAVRIDASVGPRGIEVVHLDLAGRSGESHCLVALPALPNVFAEQDGAVRIWATARYEDEDRGRVPFVLYVAGFRKGKPVGEVPIKYFAGPEDAHLVLDADIPRGADRYQLVLYADRRYRGSLSLRDIRLVTGTLEHRIGPTEHVTAEISLERAWRQEGRRLVCTSPYGEHWAEMPAGWRLDEVHPAALAAAEWILYSGVDRLAFGVTTPAPDLDDRARRYVGSNTLLSYSLGTDSTAAMALLPEETIRYYCQRPYASYLTRTGASVALPDPTPWEQRLGRVSNLIVVPNTFESIQLAAGGRHGFAHNFGYAALGCLLADHTDAGVLAFGSVLEQVFLRSGHLFADVVALERSTHQALRRLLEGAGLVLALPTGGCSEVLTTRISDAGRYAGLAISCPSATPDGTPCGRCFKCFRKLRLEGVADPPEPDASVTHTFEKYPLKSATSVMYAVQRSGYRHPVLDEYRDVDLRFLERYFDYAIEHMLPEHLRDHVRRELASLGIGPMSEEDELRLRLIGQTFWPESFSWTRAGIAEPEPAD
jgi:hypothetical protein